MSSILPPSVCPRRLTEALARLLEGSEIIPGSWLLPRRRNFLRFGRRADFRFVEKVFCAGATSSPENPSVGLPVNCCCETVLGDLHV